MHVVMTSKVAYTHIVKIRTPESGVLVLEQGCKVHFMKMQHFLKKRHMGLDGHCVSHRKEKSCMLLVYGYNYFKLNGFSFCDQKKLLILHFLIKKFTQ